MGNKKKRAPIEQLRTAGRIANEMLKAKGIIAKKSVLDEIIHTQGAPVLPGIPAYLPHEWTIKATQQMMRDFLILWLQKCNDQPSMGENITEFFKFVIGEMRRLESDINKEVVAMPKFMRSVKNIPVLKDIFSPMRKKQSAKAIQRFFIDSFATSVMLKQNHTVSEYANWFLEWTEAMHQLWIKPEKRK